MYNIFRERPLMESEEQSESQEVLEGRWMKDQHQRFLTGIVEHGKDWKIVEKVVKTRTGSQVRSHAQKFFIKLNKIGRQRKKCKNLNLIQPSDIQREILDLFKEQDITSNTPSQVIALIRKDWKAVATAFKQKKKQTKSNRPPQKRVKQSQIKNQEEMKQKQEMSANLKVISQENHDESYFIRVIKTNREHFISGHDFKELIDFGQGITCNSNEESITNTVRVSERKRSFCLPDDENNETKLKHTLQNLRREMHGAQ